MQGYFVRLLLEESGVGRDHFLRKGLFLLWGVGSSLGPLRSLQPLPHTEDPVTDSRQSPSGTSTSKGMKAGAASGLDSDIRGRDPPQ